MSWVDHPSYFGPDRRAQPSGFRLRERRRQNCAGAPPPLPTAMRQLRMHVLEAQPEAMDAFIARTQGVAELAHLRSEPGAAIVLASLAERLERWRDKDMRATIYAELDRAHASMRTLH